MVSVEVLDESGVDDVAGRNPLSLLGSVSFPIHQELFAPAPVAYCQQAFYLVNWTAFDHLRWWWGHGGRDHGAFLGWFYLTHVEGRVNVEVPGQTKSGDWERTYKPWCQFLRGNLET